eukprot:m.61818 g.61818  ORF g.61818 m.61818 type:complete len:831 (-) comp11450_c0_seq2:48-2540(-)
MDLLYAMMLATNFFQLVLGEVTVNMYNNSALVGTPHSHRSPSLQTSFTLGKGPFSAEVYGTVLYDKPGAMYAFNCSFDYDTSTIPATSVTVFVWVGDHLVCHTNPPFSNTAGSEDGTVDNPLRNLTNGPVTVVMHVYTNVNSSYSESTLDIDVKWMALMKPGASNTNSYVSIPSSSLQPELPASEIKRREVQNAEKKGWNLWTYNMLSAVRLPESCAVTTVICQLSTAACLTQTHIEDTAAQVRVGEFASDRSYWAFYLGYNGINVSLSYTGGNMPLNILAEPLNCDTANCSDYALVITGTYKWLRAGDVKLENEETFDTMTFEPYGQESLKIQSTKPHDASLPIPSTLKNTAHIALPLGDGALGITQNEGSNLADIRRAVYDAWRSEEEHSAKYGNLATVKEAVQAATMWNYVYVPSEYGPFLPVSRAWNFVKDPINDDWSYVIFDWDNIFASYMSSLDDRAKNISYSNFIQVIRSRTAKGFVPNFSAGGTKSIDRTEPPIGAYVLLEIYNKFKDKWLVELLFDDLVAWNDWFLRERTLGPLGLVSLGSDSYPLFNEFAPGTMQGSRFESGLDNSPMYDGDFFNKTVYRDGSESIGQMMLYDVGMSSMFVSEASCLATLAKDVLGRTKDAEMLTERAMTMQKKISAHLWDDQGGIYTNKFWNESFYRRISPTSFYSMLAGAATDKQAIGMVNNWLHSPKHFCIAQDGDYEKNNGSCYWGLPSIEASDVAYPPLGYWRGFVWGPMAQLTYWSMLRYDHVPQVRSGRKALCKQMTAMMLNEWERNRHICENFYPNNTKNAVHTDCSGTKFYHWGALTGMISLVEEGYYKDV